MRSIAELGRMGRRVFLEIPSEYVGSEPRYLKHQLDVEAEA
ncbi:MAG: hypothetical protein SFV15_14530 [Polyangiaceae bacterium]|nr:hypothetical protein [Polyangiaceae bacterium]